LGHQGLETSEALRLAMAMAGFGRFLGWWQARDSSIGRDYLPVPELGATDPIREW